MGFGSSTLGNVASKAVGGGTAGKIAGYAVDPLGVNSWILDKAGVDVNNLGGQVFGNGDDPGILGVGMFKPQKYDVNESAFKDSNYDARRSEFAKQLAASQGRAGVQLDQNASNQIRGRQMTLADQLTAQAAGQGPSLATMQMKQATDRNLAQAMALAASQRGGASGGLGLRNVQQQQSQIASQAARDAALARMQEQLSAREQLAGVLQGTRGQDLTAATSQAQLEADQRALNDAQARFYNQGLLDMDFKQREALMALEKLKTDQQTANEQARANAYAGAAAARGNMVGGVGSGLAAVFSDKRLKKNIKKADKDVDKMLEGYALGGEVEADSEPKKKTDLNKFLEGWSIGQKKESRDEYEGQRKAGEAIGRGLGSLAKSGPKEPSVTSSQTGQASMTPFGASSANVAYDGGEVTEGGIKKMGFDKDMLMKLAPLALMAMSDRDKKKNITDMTDGGKVPGKARVAGDSPKNDTVTARLSPGEIVLPRTVAQSGDDSKVLEFLDGIKGYKYNYKDPKHGAGTYVSPMAQDLEKTEIGKDMVVETPEGKMVDYARGAGAYLAAAANLNKRVKALEEGMNQGGVVKPAPKEDDKKRADSYKKMADSVKKAFQGS